MRSKLIVKSELVRLENRHTIALNVFRKEKDINMAVDCSIELRTLVVKIKMLKWVLNHKL